jgi:putative flavoprotein involved in K+ transport
MNRRHEKKSGMPGGLIGRCRVLLAAEDVERDVRRVADDPAVVAGRDVEEVARVHHSLGTVVHLRDRLAAEDEADVLDLAGGGADGRPDMLGPAPTRFVRRSTERRRPDAVDVEAPLLEVARLGRRIEIDQLESRHPSIAVDVSRARRAGSRRHMDGVAGEPTVRRHAVEDVEVAVIGAGQAGLAMGYFLRRQGRRFLILEHASQIAPAWRERWDSLTLFTPRRYSALPGLPFPGDPDGYPTRDEVIAYLERYAETFELPIELDSEVKRLHRGDDGRFRLELDGRAIAADQVVVATGPFQTPYVPPVAQRLSDDVFQTHAVGYRRPDKVPPGVVLVVGGGNTGFQIAKELSATHKVVLSIGSRQKPLPQRLLGRDLFWWLTKARVLDKTVDSRLGRKLSMRDTLIGSSPRELERRYGVELKRRLVDAGDRGVRFEDGSELEVDAVIWATGYRPDYSWIKLPIFDEHTRLRHRRGVTDVPGLSFLGLTWQHTRGSALIGWVKDDAEFIGGQIAGYLASSSIPSTPAPIGAGAPARQDEGG